MTEDSEHLEIVCIPLTDDSFPTFGSAKTTQSSLMRKIQLVMELYANEKRHTAALSASLSKLEREKRKVEVENQRLRSVVKQQKHFIKNLVRIYRFFCFFLNVAFVGV